MQLKSNQTTTLRILGFDAGGTAAQVPPGTIWGSSGIVAADGTSAPTGLTLTPSIDGATCRIDCLGPAGRNLVTANPPGLQGPGPTIEIEVVAGPAATFTIEAGPVTDKP